MLVFQTNAVLIVSAEVTKLGSGWLEKLKERASHRRGIGGMGTLQWALLPMGTLQPDCREGTGHGVVREGRESNGCPLPCFVTSTLKMETVCFFETLTLTYETIVRRKHHQLL
jgi:hypothetical protein